jgi:DNA-binding CsgD family transcriptional regulator
MPFWTGYRGKSLMILLSACAVSACALDVLGANLKPVAQTVFFCVLLPVASLLLRRNAVRAADSDELSSIGPVVWARKYYRACRPLALALPLYGFVYGFSCSIGANIYAESIGPFSAFVALSAPGIVMLAFSSCIRRIDYTLLQTVAVATALAFLPLLFLHGQGVAGALHLLDHIFLLACVNGFYLATCALQVDVASVRALPLERACCTGQMLHVFGTVVGWILGLGIYFYYGMEGDPLLIATAMMIAALVLCAMMLGKSSETDANSEDALQRRLIAQCAIVARDCGLSAREAELLGLTAQGLDSAAIEGRLFISKNTVKTHMYHIYRKTGVHSREELVAFVNSHDDVT